MSLPEDIAIRVHEVHKDFYLPHHREDSIKHRIITAFEKKDKGVDMQHALRGISFDIKEGEFFGILGRNGSGKSTLLKIIAEIYAPTKGHVSRRGRLVPFIELGVGFNPDLTGRENVYLNGALLGFTRKEIDAMYDEIVEFAELEEFMDQRLKNYSSGMQVRLAFSVAIRADGDILLLDEVLAVGDAAFQRKCYDYFNSLKERKKTIVFVTHSMGAVRNYCDRAILIEEGKIAFEGLGEEAAEEYLRLFNKSQYEKEKEAAQRSKERWGSGEVQFTSIRTDITNSELTVTVDLESRATVKSVVIGMDINALVADKKLLTTGVEEDLMRGNHFSIKKGEKKTLRYVYKNFFGRSDYAITASLKSPDGNYIYDFWRDAASFTNSRYTSDYFPSLYPLKIEDK